MIRSFRDKRTKAFYAGQPVREFQPFAKQAAKKLLILRNARRIEDLMVPPGNRLEALGGDRKGRFSIRINDRWRICFEWREDGPHEVEIVDYHR